MVRLDRSSARDQRRRQVFRCLHRADREIPALLNADMPNHDATIRRPQADRRHHEEVTTEQLEREIEQLAGHIDELETPDAERGRDRALARDGGGRQAPRLAHHAHAQGGGHGDGADRHLDGGARRAAQPGAVLRGEDMNRLLHAAIRTVQWAFAALGRGSAARRWRCGRSTAARRSSLISIEPAVATPGESAVLIMHVRRDAGRDCSAILTRWVIDGKGVKIDLEGQQRISAAAIRDLERRTPGLLITSVPVPLSAFAGDALLVSDLEYVCNPVQRWWRPIGVTTKAPFTIAARPPGRATAPAFRTIGFGAGG